MKIAIICSSFLPVTDGVTVAIYQRVKQLSLLGYQVKIFCPDYRAISHIYPNWQEYQGEIFPAVEVVSLPSIQSLALEFERDLTIKAYPKIIDELEHFQPDLIHVDEAERLSFCCLKLPGVKFAKQQHIPCIAWFHTNYLEYFDDYFSLPIGLNKIVKTILSWTFSKIYNSYDLTLVSSNITQSKLVTRGINNLLTGELLGVDLAQFNFQLKTTNFFTTQYNLPDLSSKIKLVFLGRLTPDKGWKFTLDSFAQLSPKILTKLAIIIAGDGTLKTQIQQHLLKLTPEVYLLGRIARESVPELLINGDIFITNSEKETRGLTLMEAAAAGIPAIAPRAGGVIDTIQDGFTGYLYQPQDIRDFLTKLEILISDRSLREVMGQKAQKLAQQWSWQQSTNNLIRIWSQAISNQNLHSL